MNVEICVFASPTLTQMCTWYQRRWLTHKFQWKIQANMCKVRTVTIYPLLFTWYICRRAPFLKKILVCKYVTKRKYIGIALLQCKLTAKNWLTVKQSFYCKCSMTACSKQILYLSRELLKRIISCYWLLACSYWTLHILHAKLYQFSM